MADNPLRQLQAQGQSVWLDYLSRDLIESGKLAALVRDDGLAGVTSNPTIFQGAISSSDTYDAQILEQSRAGADYPDMFEAIAVDDVRAAADVLRPVYDGTDGLDGYVSLEVSPRLAHDTEGTVAEAKRLFAAVGRPNTMIKVPATPEGLPAIERLLVEGLNINITLIFAQAFYEAVAEAYVRALEARAARGERLDTVGSVASTFVSRIDTAVDEELDRLGERKPEAAAEIRELLGKAAVANSKAVYQAFLRVFGSARFKRLADQGARRQRPLWASTSTKNPAYRETLYVDELIGPGTVNTMPEPTMDAFRAGGEVQETITEGLDYWLQTLERLQDLGVDVDAVMQRLLAEGVQKFIDSYDQLLVDLEAKADALVR